MKLWFLSTVALAPCYVRAYLVAPAGTPAPGANSDCSEWVQQAYGINCAIIEKYFGLTEALFEAWNPIVTASGPNCTLLPDLYYCVQINYVPMTTLPMNPNWNCRAVTGTSTSQVQTWSACNIGCYTDSAAARTLSFQVTSIPAASMTVELCLSTCAGLGYTIAGLEYAQQCFCDTSFQNGGGPTSDGNALCNMACLGNAAEMCGGGNRLDIYQLSGWSLKGCYTDSASSRSLSYQDTTIPANSMTIELCVATCASLGYIYAGLEYSQQCFCDNTIRNSGGIASDGNALCNMACYGNSAEICGGGNRLSVYENALRPSGWASLGCYSDLATARALTITGLVTGGVGANTIESCQAACFAANYTLAGVEYGQQCFCDNSIRSGGPALDGSTQCNMACTGNSAELCGGGNRLNVYQYIGWDFLGCYVDNGSARTLSQLVIVPGGQTVTTVQSCQAACLAAGYSLAGVEWAQQCWCDNVLQNGGAIAPDGSAQCNMACTGNSGEICGGPGRLSLYSHTATIGTRSWSSVGCWVDNGSSRTLAYQQTIPGGINYLTIELCQALCHDAGFILAGVEWSQECWCDQKTSNNGIASDQTTCNMPCLGNTAETCGGSGRMSLYKYA